MSLYRLLVQYLANLYQPRCFVHLVSHLNLNCHRFVEYKCHSHTLGTKRIASKQERPFVMKIFYSLSFSFSMLTSCSTSLETLNFQSPFLSPSFTNSTTAASIAALTA